MEVSRSGFYASLGREPSTRTLEDQELLADIRRTFVRHRGRYGSPRIHRELRSDERPLGRGRIERLMRENGIVARAPRRFRRTTISEHAFHRPANVLARRFDVAELNAVWASDITYLATKSGWLYLAVVLDLASRRVIGWSVSRSLESSIAIDALKMALAARDAPRLHHSDQGVQYASARFQQLLAENGIACSMSRRGNCWDNAPVESFFSTLKTECPELARRPSASTAARVVFEYIEIYYNKQRMHSSLDYIAPAEYELLVN